jgi:putative membrane protein
LAPTALNFAMNKDEPPRPPANPQTYLAVERTFLAWIRTGVALMGFGFVIARFGLFLHELALEKLAAKETESSFSIPAGIALIAVGIFVSLAAAIRYHRYLLALDRGETRTAFDTGLAYLIAVLMALIGLAVVVYLTKLL